MHFETDETFNSKLIVLIQHIAQKDKKTLNRLTSSAVIDLFFKSKLIGVHSLFFVSGKHIMSD